MRLRTLALAAALTLAAGAASAAEAWKAPRNSYGQPDLSGVWTNATITRLERDARLGDRLVLTDQEAARLEGANAQRIDTLARPTDQATKVDDLPSCGSGATGPACGYNAFWIDPGAKVIRLNGQARSSIIVDPKDGRPPLTKEAQARIQARQGDARVGNLDDPATFTQRVKGEIALNAAKGPVYEYACREGNYALPGILAGAREEERHGREQAGNRGAVREEGE